jgi:hypothetical protein
MEQVKSLITSLAEAASQGTDRMVLLMMVEEIRNQLLHQVDNTIPERRSSVSVWMPNGFVPVAGLEQRIPQTEPAREEKPAYMGVPRPPAVVMIEENTLELETEETTIPTDFVSVEANSVVPEPPAELPVAWTADIPVSEWQAPVTMAASPNEADSSSAQFELHLSEEMMKEIDGILKGELPDAKVKAPAPETEQVKELNERMVQRSKVLNELFDRKEPELAEVLSEPKVTDIRKAISINEKYQYINSLFRGDEDMFERSIRTLNNFRIWPEADYWVQRELMIKLGWNEEDELVQRFYSLVRRRFS